MPRYFCQDNPAVYELETTVLDADAGRILLEQSPFYPGGGGQLADRGRLVSSRGVLEVTDFEVTDRGIWHYVQGTVDLSANVLAQVDRSFRDLMCELHTVSHVVNALVFQGFEGALVTGVQMSGDGTFRMDFDLPGIDNDRLQQLEAPMNEAIKAGYPVRQLYLPFQQASAEPGLLRSKALTPPAQADGTVRIIEITGLDRQACGGTHLASTDQARAIRILKIENKGRHNRRLKVGLQGSE